MLDLHNLHIHYPLGDGVIATLPPLDASTLARFGGRIGFMQAYDSLLKLNIDENRCAPVFIEALASTPQEKDSFVDIVNAKCHFQSDNGTSVDGVTLDETSASSLLFFMAMLTTFYPKRMAVQILSTLNMVSDSLRLTLETSTSNTDSKETIELKGQQ